MTPSQGMFACGCAGCFFSGIPFSPHLPIEKKKKKKKKKNCFIILNFSIFFFFRRFNHSLQLPILKL